VISVVVADDHEVVRTGYAALLDTQPDFTVAGTAADGAAAVRLCGERSPDVVLMDVRMPVMDGIEATRRIAQAGLPTRVLVLTTFDLDEYVYAALRAGASGFLLKDVERDRLIDAVQTVASGEQLVGASVLRRLLDRYVRGPAPAGSPRPAALDALTSRELEVLTLLGRGRSNAEIADELIVSLATVKTHVASILRKCDLRDRVQGVVLAYESGLVVPGE
jgi:DNA-binding NarL/FixJ family response regulator